MGRAEFAKPASPPQQPPFQGQGGPPGAPPRPQVQQQLRPGGFWIRFVASFIDGIIIGIINSPISWGLQFLATGSLLAQSNADPSGAAAGVQLLSTISSFAIVVMYYGYFYTTKGSSPGKMIFGLKVVNAQNGTRLSWVQAGMRETIGKIISGMILMIGFIMAGMRSDKRALHDLMMDSQVLRQG